MTASPTTHDAVSDATTVRPVLEVRGLFVEIDTGDQRAAVLSDVGFSIAPGETLGLVGESGSGKTMTAKAIMGLLPRLTARVTGGEIVLDGVDLLGLSTKQLREIRGDTVAMIFQEPMTSLNPAFTVGDQIAETVRRHRGVSKKAAWARTVEVLSDVGIAAAERRSRSYPHEFSGGMRQRVMIAMALCCEPALLIADEPTTALDVTVQAQVLDLIRHMREALGMAMLFVTHDLGVIADVSDRVVVMYAGQVVEQSGVLDLFRRPAHPYTEALLNSMPGVEAGPRGTLLSIPGQPPAAGDFPVGCRFHQRCGYAAEECTTAGIPLTVVGAQETRCLLHTDLPSRPPLVDLVPEDEIVPEVLLDAEPREPR
ncbi:MAG: ABC transporter ATP-binding protein [Pseudonocardia sp.]|nr:ABC transporter ATP-binding protein [Pseudonocardia sp.]